MFNNRVRAILAILVLLALVAVGVAFVGGDKAAATGNDDPCVPSEAYTETIEHEAVTETVNHEAEYEMLYHFRKFTRERHKHPDAKGFWQNFQPNKQNKKFVGPPSHPTDERGTWSAPKVNGGPQPEAQGVFQNGQGNGSWFYRAPAVTTEWSEYGDWSPWEPETHTSWETSSDPLGVPQFHSKGTYEDGTKWERQWQALFDGETKQGKLIKEAWTEIIVIEEAWTETIEHPAVVCPPTPTETPTTPTETPTTPTETPTTPTETPTETPTTPTETPSVTPSETPETTPSDESTPDEPTKDEENAPEVPVKENNHNPSERLTECVDGTWVTTLDGEVIAESGSCDASATTRSAPVVVQEEGL